ncbi:MFS transporter [Chitinophaga ginsengisegetis]|uniref:MFS transporter n=1 Tax=Chitinophaga ginsengisegetis TaxID=393003 RepID=UPI000DBA50BB|nr:MFS transporter [Chitinophaga ginsengisegetis]MDR6567563.1 EmrB/QacA subfamily drug resistance transporter [Chitinophaga ginsengisegetis]MDR6647882.1 EmrB/QacA subfamily drug resistance transporter [Chitinophaga ginsengisegetis]MDR6654232.1 EmrB/QacA subfamily drug resistance transporter [Chitinophaga ginsengisegetis]
MSDLTMKAPPVAEQLLPGSWGVKAAVTGIALILFMVNLDTSIVIVGLPVLIAQLHASFASAQWVVLSYMLLLTALIAGAGRLGDIFGKKKLYLAGIALFTVASLGCGIAPGIGTLIVCRGLQGVGAAFCLSLSFAIAGDMVPKARLGKTMGWLTMMVPLGIASGPTCGGILISTLGWQSMFLVNIPIGVVAYTLVRRHVPVVAKAAPQRTDWTGMILLAGVLVCYCMGMTFMEDKGPLSQPVLLLLAGFAAGLVLFIRYEKKVPQPFLQLQLFRNSLLSASLLAAWLVYTVIMATVVLLPFYLVNEGHYTPLQTGLLMSFGPLVTAVLSVFAGKAADRFHARKVMLAGVLVMVAGCLAMSSLSTGQGIFGFLWRIGLIQLGLTFFQTPNNTAVMELAAPEQRGLMSGLLSLARTTGHITGTAVLGAVFALLIKSGTITHAISVVFLVAAVLVAVAALLIYLVLRTQGRRNNA